MQEPITPFPMADASEDSCAICCECLETEDGDEPSYRLPCGHTFHCGCIVRWFRAGSDTCPSCRSTPSPEELASAMSPMDIMERCRYLRQRARSKRAPTELHRLVAKLRKAEEAHRERRRALLAFRREHRDVLTQLSRMRAASWTSDRRIRRAKRAIGLFAHPSMPLPAVSMGPRIFAA